MVVMPDGSQVPADQYTQERVNEVQQEHRRERDQIVNWAMNQTAAQQQQQQQEQPETEPPQQMQLIDIENTEFESTNERQLAEQHNATVNYMNSQLQGMQARLEKQQQEFAAREFDRAVDAAQDKWGVSFEEMDSVYREMGGTVTNPDALGELVSLRKGTSNVQEQQQQVHAQQMQNQVQQATQERANEAAVVGGQSGAGTAPHRQDAANLPGRGLQRNQIYNGEEIAKRYQALEPRPGHQAPL